MQIGYLVRCCCCCCCCLKQKVLLLIEASGWNHRHMPLQGWLNSMVLHLRREVASPLQWPALILAKVFGLCSSVCQALVVHQVRASQSKQDSSMGLVIWRAMPAIDPLKSAIEPSKTQTWTSCGPTRNLSMQPALSQAAMASPCGGLLLVSLELLAYTTQQARLVCPQTAMHTIESSPNATAVKTIEYPCTTSHK